MSFFPRLFFGTVGAIRKVVNCTAGCNFIFVVQKFCSMENITQVKRTQCQTDHVSRVCAYPTMVMKYHIQKSQNSQHSTVSELS